MLPESHQTAKLNAGLRASEGKLKIHARSLNVSLNVGKEGCEGWTIRGATGTKIRRRAANGNPTRVQRNTKARLSRHVSIILCQIVCRRRGTSCSFLDPLALAPRNLCVTVTIEILCRSSVVQLFASPSTTSFVFFFFRSFFLLLLLLSLSLSRGFNFAQFRVYSSARDAIKRRD